MQVRAIDFRVWWAVVGGFMQSFMQSPGRLVHERCITACLCRVWWGTYVRLTALMRKIENNLTGLFGVFRVPIVSLSCISCSGAGFWVGCAAVGPEA